MEVIIIKANIKKPLVIKLIIFIELIIYCLFIYIDYNTNFKSIYSPMIKYFGILTCLLLVTLIGSDGHDKKDTKLLVIAFFFTASADFLMVILNFNTIGILVFSLAQITYILRHRRGVRSKVKLTPLIAAVVIVAFTSLMVVQKNTMLTLRSNKLIITIGSVYAVLLFYSVYTGWKTVKGNFYPVHSRYLISIGLTLFLFCDVNVALSSIFHGLFIVDKDISTISRFLIWVFYFPSQVLLALSGYKKYIIKEKVN